MTDEIDDEVVAKALNAYHRTNAWRVYPGDEPAKMRAALDSAVKAHVRAGKPCSDMAADLIEALVAALEPFAKPADEYDPDWIQHDGWREDGNVVRARAVLTKAKS